MSMPNVNAVILCGGVGTRLWPLSREKLPKQLLPLVNSKSMLQNTITRVNSINSTHSDHGLKINKFIFICNADHSFIIQQQIAELDVELAAENKDHVSIQDRSTIITEPEGRNTAPAIAISTLYTDPTDMSLVVPADHVFDDNMFMKLVSDKVLSYNPSMCLFGIRPSYPATGYGYIESSGIINKHIVRSFIEKPNEETATKYMASGKYYWNAGVFLFQNKVMLDCFQKYEPTILEHCASTLNVSTRNKNVLSLSKEHFTKCKDISIDYAIMERMCEDPAGEIPVIVYPYSGEWCDVGSYKSLHEHLLTTMKESEDGNFNVIKGDNLAIDTKECIIYSEKTLVSTIGVSNLVIVSTPDVVLVCNKDNTQDIKRMVQELKKQQRPEASLHQKVYRPWGWYENLDGNDNSGVKVKRLVVLPKMRLSLQSHNNRQEHWVVANGKARVHLDKDLVDLEQNEYIHIPLQSVHRVENIGDTPLEIIETQVGNYLGEDDIIRYEDDFGRV